MAYNLNFTGTRITDALAGALTGADLTAYNALSTDALEPISATGFAALSALSGVYVAGMPNATITGTVQAGLYPGGGGWQNTISSATNTNYISGYAIAFRVRGDANKSIAAGTQLGYSTTVTGAGGTAFQVSTTSRATTTDANGYAYYVVKRPSVLIPNGAYVRAFVGALTAGSNYSYVIPGNNNASNYGLTTVTSTATATFNGYLTMQVLQLPTKQW
jgi:hypothetical protein